MLATNVVFTLVIILSVVHYSTSAVATSCQRPNSTDVFVDRIFAKYGKVGTNNLTVINETGLNNLLKDLALTEFTVVCEEGDRECIKDRIHFVKGDQDPLRTRKRRSADHDHGTEDHDTTDHDAKVTQQKKLCAQVRLDIDSKFKFAPSTGMNKTDFLNLCPFLVERIADKACVHYHVRYPEFKPPDHPPSSAEKWGYGMIAITICSLLSLAVIAMIPCLQKTFYEYLMAYLVAMAVGTLCGDALLHLIPHAFIEGANLAAGIEVSEEQEEQQHLSQVYRALIVMGGIYLFFIVEQLMKLKASLSKGHSHDHGNSDEPMMDIASGEVKVVEGEGHAHGPSGHAHSHGDKNITGQTNISSVAWMVVVGDGFHNFSDGLAVGAAFSASLSSGISTTIAIFCHELPHELGDFAVLLKAGMTAKQAITYNLVGAFLSYIGCAIGIVAGTSVLGRHIILCLTAGLFFYVSLVNMMSEVVGTENDTFKLATVICQHLGMLSGIAIMLVISIFEHDI